MSAICSGRRPSWVGSTKPTLEPTTGRHQRLRSDNHYDHGHRVRLMTQFPPCARVPPTARWSVRIA